VREQKIFIKLLDIPREFNMVEVNKFYNEDCLNTMSRMEPNSIDCVITSPPYNMTKRKGGYADKQPRYDEYQDWKNEREYNEWTCGIFNSIDNVLVQNGVILYNFSYSIENPSLPYTMMASIIDNTPFMVADTIIWKKSNSIPHPASYNRLNRIVEFIFVIVRKSELKTFNCYKEVSKISPKGQKYYEIVDNFIIAKNNDESTTLNKATYSTELCTKLMKIYSKEGDIIYDPFMGTGTTALACKLNNRNFVGSEISRLQVEYSYERFSSKN
jgi:site-specific DNA-methyltransferase (adenine-specific)/modification methylase